MGSEGQLTGRFEVVHPPGVKAHHQFIAVGEIWMFDRSPSRIDRDMIRHLTTTHFAGCQRQQVL